MFLILVILNGSDDNIRSSKEDLAFDACLVGSELSLLSPFEAHKLSNTGWRALISGLLMGSF